MACSLSVIPAKADIQIRAGWRLPRCIPALAGMAACLGGCDRAVEPLGDNSRMIECGPVGGALRRSCRLEADDRKDGLHLTIRLPDGGFRRLAWPKGSVLVAADGAEPVVVTQLKNGGIEARIGGWRYRIEPGKRTS